MAAAEDRNQTEKLADDVIELVQTYYKLTLVTATRKSSGVAASIVVVLIISVFFLLVIAFAGLALGHWLGNLLSNMATGYLITAGFYLLVTLILIVSRKKLFAYVRDIIVRKIYE
ncbi:hypothetical protein [Pseudoflavitalea rhizosphaerae]|uniref:hypothetical protein n=1 Tax=Pseudoflavitalea rhizosphaerae TaxID=1884793 RepID=UPI000F8F3845|nr:hypothetical protein [Pseudoflavitalea rhizosphaerae]